MSGKREDLQGLRGLAIVAVVAFHFFPVHFPNGYVGVDQFFVLSGFLMCMLLDKASGESPVRLVLHFYSRRLRRILPVYLLVVFAVSALVLSTFPPTAIETNTMSVRNALMFASNRPQSEKTSYFELLNVAVDAFTHTWSLSVEVQFYAVVPFLFLLAQVLPRAFQSKYYLILGLASFAFHALSSKNTAFYNMFARAWQFIIDLDDLNEADYAEAERQELDPLFAWPEEKQDLPQLIAVLLMMFGAFAPMQLDALYVRLNTTVLSGLLLSSSSAQPLLNFRVLSYLGDISYSLYMVHWPIYAYCILNYPESTKALVIGLFSAFLIAVLLTYTFEKWQMRSAPTLVLATILILYVLNISVLLRQWKIQQNQFQKSENTQKRKENFDVVDPSNMTIDEIFSTNSQYNVNDYENLLISQCNYTSTGPLGICQFQGLKPTGKYKILFVGNSWTANHGRMIYQECKNKAYNITQFSAMGCEPLYPFDERCKENLKVVEGLFKEVKPDFAFIIFRIIQLGDALTSENLIEDEKYNFAKERLMLYREHVKIKVFLLDSIPWASDAIADVIKDGIVSNKPINDSLIVNKPALERHERAKKRIAQLVADCGSKCERISYESSFFNQTTHTFRYYDKYGIEYFTRPNHLSPHGLEVVRPIYRRICGSL